MTQSENPPLIHNTLPQQNGLLAGLSVKYISLPIYGFLCDTALLPDYKYVIQLDIDPRTLTMRQDTSTARIPTENSYYFSVAQRKLGFIYSHTIMSRELQTSPQQIATLSHTTHHLPSIEIYLRCLAVMETSCDHIIKSAAHKPHLRGSSDDYRVPVTLTDVSNRVRETLNEYLLTNSMVKLSKTSGLTRPTLYKMKRNLDATTSLRSLFKLAISLSDTDELEDIGNTFCQFIQK